MANKLRKKNARVSFFAFQDMITTVTGVLILIMILLSLRVSQSAFNERATERDEVRDRLTEARRQLALNTEALRKQQAQLSALTNRIFVIHEPDRSGKQPVLIVISATNGWCARLGETNQSRFRARRNGGEFENLLAGWNPTREQLVFYVRPSGVAHFDLCRQLALARGFSIGYDAAAEEGQYDWGRQ
jgi:hypothetical protein